jgi:fused signal recognition particle receptor
VDSVALYLVIGVVVALVALVVIIGLVRGKSKKAAPPIAPGSATPDTDESSGGQIPAARGGVDADTTDVVDDGSDTLTLERPEEVAGRFARLRARLARGNKLGQSLLGLLSRSTIDETTWDEIEEILLTSDLGVAPTNELMERLRTEVKIHGTSDPAVVRDFLRKELLALVDPSLDRSLHTDRNMVLEVPSVVIVVGVNGTGKTTTTGKLARLLVAEDEDVLLGAADTFRAAAAEQLTTWGQRVGVPVVRGPEGSDPASVAFEAVGAGIEQEVDCVIIDTAGRLHTKVGLMDELGKVKRVIEKQAPVSEVLLVLDATTGQNGLVQAKVFSDVVDVTGVVLTKLDGTAKGGIVVAVQRQLGVPVKLVGLGEGPDDLAPFDAAAFVDTLLGA